jgi:hypothetical protein
LSWSIMSVTNQAVNKSPSHVPHAAAFMMLQWRMGRAKTTFVYWQTWFQDNHLTDVQHCCYCNWLTLCHLFWLG